MLSISNVGAGQAGSYYEKDGYYVRMGDTDSKWFGALQEDLNLQETITKQDFNELVFERKERAGYDLTFSAPKSVSIAICMDEATRKDMLEAHNKAVETVLARIEKEAIGARVTKNGVTEHVKTENMICGRFNHYVNRNSDPQLHTHAVILNKTKYNDTYYAVDNPDLYKNKVLYGQIYRNTLAAELMKRGYDTEVTDKGKGFFELKDMDKSLLEQFSSRRAEIVEQLKKWDATDSAQSAAKAAVMTRHAKEHKDIDMLIKSWRETVNEMGGIKLDKSDSPVTRSEQEKLDRYNQAIKNLSRKDFAWTENGLIKAVLAAGVDHGLTAAEAEKMAKADRSLIDLGEKIGEKKGQSYYTTIQNLKTEQAIFNKVAATKGKMKGISEKRVKEILAGIEKAESLSIEQRQAVIGIAKSNDQYFAVQGLAGTGKTYMLDYARQVLEAEGYTVKGACFTGKAADGLQTDSHIPSVTLHSHLNALEKDAGNKNPDENIKEKTAWNFEGLQKGDSKEAWVIDEASLVDNSIMKNLMEAAKLKEAKVVFVGDNKQLPPVGVGNSYGNMIQTQKIDYVVIEDIRRQKDSNLLESVREAVNGDINKSFQLLDKNIYEISENKERVNAIVKNYTGLKLEERAETIILTASNTERRAINKRIRQELKGIGQLGEGKEFKIEDKDGRSSKKEFSKGDRIIFLENDHRLSVLNGQAGMIEGIKDNILVVKQGDRTLEINTDNYKKFDHGYTITAHKAQGITIDRALINFDSNLKQMNTRNAYYVDISRARQEVKIFTDDKDKMRTQVKDFAKKITSEDFLIPKKEARKENTMTNIKNLYNNVKSNVHKQIAQIKAAKNIENTLNSMDKMKNQSKEKDKGRNFNGMSF